MIHKNYFKPSLNQCETSVEVVETVKANLVAGKPKIRENAGSSRITK